MNTVVEGFKQTNQEINAINFANFLSKNTQKFNIDPYGESDWSQEIYDAIEELNIDFDEFQDEWNLHWS